MARNEAATEVRPPTEQEQLIIAAVWEGISRAAQAGFYVEAIGMGHGLITDRIRGDAPYPSTWTQIFGRPVIETSHDPASLTMMVRLELPESPA